MPAAFSLSPISPSPPEWFGAFRFNLDFTYGTTDNNGNVRTQTINAPPIGLNVQQIYGYDGVNRLASVSEGGWSRAYYYDAFGNRAAQGSGVGDGTPRCVEATNPGCNSSNVLTTPAFDGNNRLKTTWAGYDGSGNLTHFQFPNAPAFDWTAAYDAENKQRWFCGGTSAPCGAGNFDAEYRYDGDGNRVQKALAGGATTTYVYDAFGRLAAEYSTAGPSGPGGIEFRTTDHLGSTRLVTDAAGAAVSRRDFFPFGEEIPANATFNRAGMAGYNQTSGFTQQFTGKERDAESGLDYFGARYFGSSLGRFTSPDAPFLDQNPIDPQSWNLYGYVRNRPLTLVDPDGRTTRISADGTVYDVELDGDTSVVQTTITINYFAEDPGNVLSVTETRVGETEYEDEFLVHGFGADREIADGARIVLDTSFDLTPFVNQAQDMFLPSVILESQLNGDFESGFPI